MQRRPHTLLLTALLSAPAVAQEVGPVFADGQMVAIAGTLGHHLDVGGMRPGSYAGDATEIFQEGLRIPPIKIARNYTLDPRLVDLIGANMPSILAEVSFISNPEDERLLKSDDQRQQIAEALFEGVRSYSNTLSGFATAKIQQ